ACHFLSTNRNPRSYSCESGANEVHEGTDGRSRGRICGATGLLIGVVEIERGVGKKTINIATVSLPYDFKVPKDMFKGRRDPGARLMQYNDYMNVLEASNAAKCKAFTQHSKEVPRTGRNDEWAGSNMKRRTHMMSVMSGSAPKRPCRQEKWSIEFGSDDEELVHDKEGNDPMVLSGTTTDFEVKRILLTIEV
ncbi:hypothetical protein J1N35_008242, partial [Gossypium stocksii]